MNAAAKPTADGDAAPGRDPAASLVLGSQSWSPDLLFLRNQCPPETWPGNPALGELAQFWLHKHTSLRQLGASLAQAGVALREGRLAPADLQATFIPPLGQFLDSLESHHQVEDHHYFPRFRSAEPRLAHGFDILERDHDRLHGQILSVVELANAFVRHPATDALRNAADRYCDAVDVLTTGLGVHLADEEDLVIPLLATRLP